MSGDLTDGLPTAAQQPQDLSPSRIGNCPEHGVTSLASYGNHLVTDIVTKWLP
jgi:DNA-binding FrmR family transcriptional regulator